ncbi:MAG: hypothetical protein HC765_02370 [Brachymonas sp.]|nr:hypothetical protein [Brachymonas sp.]
MLDACQIEPVFIAKAGRPHGVLVSMQTFIELQTQSKRAKDTSDVGAAFYAAHQSWMDHHNALVDQHGVWSEGLMDPPSVTHARAGAADGSV